MHPQKCYRQIITSSNLTSQTNFPEFKSYRGRGHSFFFGGGSNSWRVSLPWCTAFSCFDLIRPSSGYHYTLLFLVYHSHILLKLGRHCMYIFGGLRTREFETPRNSLRYKWLTAATVCWIIRFLQRLWVFAPSSTFINILICEVITAVDMKNYILWAITPCDQLTIYSAFHLHPS
jgi:hypothetical protein